MRSIFAFALAMLVVGCDTAEESELAGGVTVDNERYGVYDDWDTDNNDLIDETEFRTGLGNRNMFGTYDQNQSGVLEENEWRTEWGAFDTFDADRNAGISEDEFNTGVFDGWDLNDDRGLDENEWGTGVSTL